MRSLTPINQLPPSFPSTYAFRIYFHPVDLTFFFQVPMGTRFIYLWL